MSETGENKPRITVALSGNMLQFNITIFVIAGLLFGLLFLCSKNSNPVFYYGGTAVGLLAIIALMILVIWFYTRQRKRPTDGQSVAVSIKSKEGEEISVNNPPDDFLNSSEFNTIVRLMLVGYDYNLCPDGEVLGKASDGNFRQYSQEEREEFMKAHRAEITGKKKQAKIFLQASSPESKATASEESEPPPAPESANNDS